MSDVTYGDLLPGDQVAFYERDESVVRISLVVSVELIEPNPPTINVIEVRVTWMNVVDLDMPRVWTTAVHKFFTVGGAYHRAIVV